MSGESLTFFNLFNRVGYIEIPILQRDYAQGRSEESEVRSLFLRSLSHALTDTDKHTLDLDFVYGNFENRANGSGEQSKVFSVLDGQQRLTTLFLLHWYLAQVGGRQDVFRGQFVSPEGRSRFSYKTRPGTSEFFNALVTSDLELSDAPISEIICDSQWFYLSWQQDPTVKACLCMLDAIQKQFDDHAEGFFDRLFDTNQPCITFQFLDLHAFGLSDELYIKMNARGKPLTFFENFKAKLEQYISSFTQPWPEYYLPGLTDSVSGQEYFNNKVDTVWADLFWPYRNTCSEDNTFDDEFMNFFRFMIMAQSLLDNRKNPHKLTALSQKMIGYSGRLIATSLSKYDELGCFSQAFIVRFISFMDLISENGLINNKIGPYLTSNIYYSEQSTFEQIITNTASYDDKLRFYAFYSFLDGTSDLGELNQRMRVIYNLVEHTITDTSERFCNALFTVDDLSRIDQPILKALKSGYKLSAFHGAQILEEEIKSHLILRSDSWKSTIMQAERHSSFDGQIGVLLHFSGVLAYFRGFKDCSWDDDQDSVYLAEFNRYFKNLSVVLDRIKNTSVSINYAWERAVLGKGNYCTTATRGRFNLLHSRDTRNNIPRDHSWRRRLRIGSAADEDRQQFVKAVLDDPLFNAENLQASLEAICEKALAATELESWRRNLIKYPEIFEYCGQGFVAQESNEVVLLSQSQRNHYHCDLNSKVLELTLKAAIGRLTSFTGITLDEVKSRDDQSAVRMRSCVVDKHLFQLVIQSVEQRQKVIFRSFGGSEYPGRIKEVLERKGFEWSSNGDKGSEYFYTELSDVDQTVDFIVGLSADLEALKV